MINPNRAPTDSDSKSWRRCETAAGVGILLDLEVETTAFAATDLVETAFTLPPSDKPVQLVASICSRRLSDGVIIYGLEFDAERSKDFSRHQDAIVDYAMRRQREDLLSEARHRR